jgi:hypothetical protein
MIFPISAKLNCHTVLIIPSTKRKKWKPKLFEFLETVKCKICFFYVKLDETKQFWNNYENY